MGISTGPVGAVSELRRMLSSELQRGGAAWIGLSGLSLGRRDDHSALQRVLARTRIDGFPAAEPPSRVVLDWSGVETMTAEGFALFSVLVRRLLDAARDVTVCRPACSDLRQALYDLGLYALPQRVTWVECAPVRARRVRALVPAAVFGGSLGRGNIGEFLDNLSRELAHVGAPRQQTELLEAAAVELTQNTRAHAGGAWATAVALIEHSRRPPRIQIGLADAGPGVANHLLQRIEHHGLAPFTDFTVLEAVMTMALTGRADGGGGGFSRLARRIINDFGGSVWIRSGAGLVQVGEGPHGRATGVRLGSGFGTQVRITIPMSA
jgi:hypothetical protein